MPARGDDPPEPPAVTVLCITGWCRNGSTIIGNILNEIPGVFHVGELHFLWKNAAGKGANSLCGCGKVLTQCPFWAEIVALSTPTGVSLDDFAAEVIRRQRACVRTRHTWRVLRRGLDRADIRAHAALMSQTYRAIADRSGATVIVDTSKIPGEAALLPHLDGVRPYFVHLVRDPRAVADSWREPKDYVYAMSATKSTLYWQGFNLATEAITRRYPNRSAFMRHEEFIADPAGTIDRLLSLCGTDPAANPVHGRIVELHANHTVTGNPDRFRAGPTELREADDRWKTGLSGSARLAASMLAGPRLRRYGYGAAAVPRPSAQAEPPTAKPRQATKHR